jgi:hypothetical protein
MAGWDKGRATIDALIGSGEIERVPASRHAAEAELARARTHVDSARQLLAKDPESAYTLAYDAARRALAAVLQNQGLRVTSRRDESGRAHGCLRGRPGPTRSAPGVHPASVQPHARPAKRGRIPVVGGSFGDSGGGRRRRAEGGGAHRACGEGRPEHASLLKVCQGSPAGRRRYEQSANSPQHSRKRLLPTNASKRRKARSALYRGLCRRSSLLRSASTSEKA